MKTPGMHIDGGGLYLRIGTSGAKSWIYRYRNGTKLHDLGLGNARDITLAEARDKARELRRSRINGVDPIAQRREARAQAALLKARSITFQDAAEAYIAEKAPGWKNAKHGDQWRATLKAYAYPVFGSLAVADIDTPLVIKALEEIWREKTETASRVRGRIESVLDWCRVRGYRTGDNPAQWKGHLDHILPARSEVAPVKHHAALPHAELPAFLARVREQPGMSALACEFLILTATRTSETIEARWEEINFDEALWTIPAERMKAKLQHRVPLSARAVEILVHVAQARQGDVVFPGAKAGKPLSNMAILKLLERMGRRDLTGHGFRATFKTWCDDAPDIPAELAEACLAHINKDKVERAYQRSDFLDRRRGVMNRWGAFCE